MVIEARVQQKTDTLANWNANPLVLLSGEPAFIVSENGQPLNFRIGDGTKPFAQLPNWIAYDQAAYKAIIGNVLPASDGQIHYSIVGAGTYTQPSGGSLVIADNQLGIISNDLNQWSIDNVIDLPKGSDGATLNQLFDPAKVGGYGMDVKVRDADYNEYTSLVDSNTAELTDPTKWKPSKSKDESVNKVLKSFIKSVTSTPVSISSAQLGFINNSNVFTSETALRCLVDYPVGDNKFLIFKGARYTADNPVYLGSIPFVLGKKGTIYTVLMKARNASADNLISEELTVDIEGYDSISLNWFKSGSFAEVDPVISLSDGVIKDDAVLNYINEKIERETEPANNQLDFIINQGLIFRPTDGLKNILGVAPTTGVIMSSSANYVEYDEDKAEFYAWSSIDVNQFSELSIDFIRIGGNSNANLIGVKEDDSLVILISGHDNPTGELETLSFDLTTFKAIHLALAVSEINLESQKQRVFFPKITYNDLEDYILKNGGGGGSSDGSTKIIDQTFVQLEKPTSIARLDISGSMPSDRSDARNPVRSEVKLTYNNHIQMECLADLSIQGSGTGGDAKMGLTTAFKNYDGEELKIGFGRWVVSSEYHVKAYARDQTMARDLFSARTWHSLRTSRPFPESYIADLDAGDQIDNTKKNTMSKALFYLDSFPLEIWLNGSFWGLYMCRLKKERENYMLDNSKAKNILLETQALSNWTVWDPAHWERRSPKVESADYTATCQRFFDWTNKVRLGTVDFEATANQYMNVGSFVDYIINKQVMWDWDKDINNVMLVCWNQVFSILYIDTDQGIGTGAEGSDPAAPMYFTVDANQLIWRGDFFKDVLYPKLISRIKDRYTELRKSGNPLDMNSMYKRLREITSQIPKETYERELIKWKAISWADQGKQSERFLLTWLDNRLIHLDTIWKL